MLLCIAVFIVSFAAAQTAEEDTAETAKGKGITATLELKMDAFNLKNSTFGSPELRGSDAQNNTVSQFFITTSAKNPNAANSWTDSVLSIGYEGEHFGGNYALKAADFISSPYALLGKVRGWVQFSFFKVLIGNDIETSYADALDADPGLRIYIGGNTPATWNTSVNPDNITQDEGIMVEALLDRFNIALSAGEFLSEFIPGKRQNNGTENDDNEYHTDYTSSYRFGARLGYDIGELGKVNLSYILSHRRIADMYKNNTDGVRVPDKAQAQEYTHLFGLYGSLHLTPQIDLTIGYNGVLTAYLDQTYYNNIGWVATGYPIIFKNGLNINARARILPQLTLRTDHSASFWQDKDYSIFEKTNQLNWNKNIVSKAEADAYAPINHLFIWNGLGAEYNFTDKLTGTVYLRNLFGQYSASGQTPGGEHTYVFTRDQVHVKLGIAYQFTSFAKAYAEVIVEDTITSRSLDLNSQSIEFFQRTIHNKTPVPVSTTDNELVVRIPIGITLQLR